MSGPLPTNNDATDDLLAETRWLRALVRGLVDDLHAAEDVAQETMGIAQHSAVPVRHRRAWLATVARRLARRRHHRETQRVRVEESVARPHGDDDADPATLAARAELHRTALDAVLGLAEPYRTTLLLHYQEGLALVDVARRTGVPVETARTRHKRGLAQVRSVLDRREGGRAAWLGVALAIPPAGTPQVPLTAWKPLWIGSAAMSIKTLTTATAGVAATALLAWGFWPDERPPAPTLAGGEQVTGTPLAAGGPDKDPAAAPTERTAVADERPAAPVAATGVLTGRVIDEITGAPLRGARVSWRSFGPRPEGDPQTATTGDDGRFALDTDRDGARGSDVFRWISARVRADDHAVVDVNVNGSRARREAKGPWTLDVGDVSVPPGSVVSGRVTDAQGAPVADATLVVGGPRFWMGGAPRPLVMFRDAFVCGRSDDDGRFTLDARLPRMRRTLFALAGDRGIGWATMADLRRSDHRVTCDIRLQPAGALAVRVVDPDGNPVHAASVEVRPCAVPFAAPTGAGPWLGTLAALRAQLGGATDADGALHLPGLPLLPRHRAEGFAPYSVTVEAEGFTPWRRHDVALDPGGGADLIVTLEPTQLWAVTGIVVDDDGRGVGNAAVGAGALRGTTAADGTFRIEGLPAASGAVAISARAKGFRSVFDTVRVSKDGEAALQDLRVPLQRSAPLFGVVVDHDGVPVAGARLREDRSGKSMPFPPEVLHLQTDAQGRFRTEDAPAREPVELAVTPPHGMPGLRHGQHTARAADSPLRLVVDRAVAPRQTTALVVHCLAANGARLEAQSVDALPLREIGDVERSDLEAADDLVIGRASFDGLAAGRWRVVVLPFEGPEFHAIVDIPDGAPRIEATAIQPAAATVQLRITWPVGADRPEQLTLRTPPGTQAARLGTARQHANIDPEKTDTLRIRDADPRRPLVVRAEGTGWRGVVRVEAPGSDDTATLVMQREATVELRSDGPLDYKSLRIIMRHEAEPWGYPVYYGVAAGKPLRHETTFAAGKVHYRMWLPTEGTSNTDERAFREGTLELTPGGRATLKIPTTAR